MSRAKSAATARNERTKPKPGAGRWLLKSEPEVFGIEDLKAAEGRRTYWDGVRNYQARNFMRDRMKRGDLAFFYHSNCAQPGIAGIVRIVREGYPDHTAFDPKDDHFDPQSDPDNPRWYMVDIELERKLKRVITLAELKPHADGALDGFALLRRGNRLSVMPVEPEHWQFILTLE
jgi:predicted RNA-binding protein with PUA-like domain